MTTVESVNRLYDNNVNSLRNYCNNQIMNIIKSNATNYKKNEIIKSIRGFYFRVLDQIKKKRDNMLNILNKKYKALLVGINYKNTKYELNGCINDVKSISQYLNSKNISNDNILLLTDETEIKPTKENIVEMFKKLLTESNSGDNLVFYYSGHGYYIENTSDNKDTEKHDDVLVTLDLKYIVDDDLNEYIHKYLKPDVNLFVLFDCCHSGTMLDLRYNYPLKIDDNVHIDESSKDTLSNVYYISGCKDGETSIETFISSKVQGAMTWGFLDAVKKNEIMSWKYLIHTIRENMKKYNFIQIPQFSTGLNCDVNSNWIFSK